MERTGRIKILRGNKSDVGDYPLQYGQPFYDTGTGQLYVGQKVESTNPSKKINETPTIFQDINGNIRIGNTNIINTTNTIIKIGNATGHSASGFSDSELNNGIIIGNNIKPPNDLSANARGLLPNDLSANARGLLPNDIFIGNNITLYLTHSNDPIIQLGTNSSGPNAPHYSLYIGPQQLYHYSSGKYVLGNIPSIPGTGYSINELYAENAHITSINGSDITTTASTATNPNEAILGGTTKPINTLNVRTINLIV